MDPTAGTGIARPRRQTGRRRDHDHCLRAPFPAPQPGGSGEPPDRPADRRNGPTTRIPTPNQAHPRVQREKARGQAATVPDQATPPVNRRLTDGPGHRAPPGRASVCDGTYALTIQEFIHKRHQRRRRNRTHPTNAEVRKATFRYDRFRANRHCHHNLSQTRSDLSAVCHSLVIASPGNDILIPGILTLKYQRSTVGHQEQQVCAIAAASAADSARRLNKWGRLTEVRPHAGSFKPEEIRLSPGA